MRFTRAAWTLVFAVALCGGTRPAQAGNDDAILVGNQAAIMGGAVSAKVADASATCRSARISTAARLDCRSATTMVLQTKPRPGCRFQAR